MIIRNTNKIIKKNLTQFRNYSWKSQLSFGFDRVQYMLPQNMPHWHNKHFKLKEFEKQQVLEEFSDLPLKQVIRPRCEKYPPYTWRKGASLSLRGTLIGIWTNRSCQALPWPRTHPSLLHWAQNSPQLFHLHQTSYRNTQVPLLFQVFISLWRLVHHRKFILNTFVCFTLYESVYCYGVPSQEFRRIGGKYIFNFL